MPPKIVRVQDPTAPVLEVFRQEEEGKRVVGTIAMCTRDKIAASTAISWLYTDHSFLDPKTETVARYIVQGHILPMQRNLCIQRMQGDWIIFVDDDMTWQPDAIGRLVTTHRENQLDMVGALCFQRGTPYQPTLYMREAPDEGRYIFLEDWTRGEVREVDATGMAFVLITKRLLEALAGEFPPFEERIQKPPPQYFRWDGKFGEDLTFCQDVKKAGVKIFVDTGIDVGHVGELLITEETFLGALANRREDSYRAQREVNTALGLPTLSPGEAKAILGRRQRGLV